MTIEQHAHERRFDPHHCASLMSDERRARWNPPSLLALAGLGAGQNALDLGSGPGFWTLPMAEIVGASGTVHALDVSKEMLTSIVNQNSSSNIHPLQGELPNIPLKNASVDFTWAAFVFHEVEPPDALADEIRRVSRRNGRIAVLDWHPESQSGNGPPRHHRLSPHQLERILSEVGFGSIQTIWQDEEAYLICAGLMT